MPADRRRFFKQSGAALAGYWLAAPAVLSPARLLAKAAASRHFEVTGVKRSTLRVPYRAIPQRAMDRELPHWRFTEVFEVGLNLGYGHYALTVAVHASSGHMDQNHDWIDNVLSFQVIPGESYRFAGVASLPASASFRKP